MGMESNRNRITNASHPHTLQSPTSQRSNQSLAKSVPAPMHDQNDRQKNGRKRTTKAQQRVCGNSG